MKSFLNFSPIPVFSESSLHFVDEARLDLHLDLTYLPEAAVGVEDDDARVDLALRPSMGMSSPSGVDECVPPLVPRGLVYEGESGGGYDSCYAVPENFLWREHGG